MAETPKVEADDPRVQWLARKVASSLGCDAASFTKLIASTPATYEMKETVEKYLAGAWGWDNGGGGTRTRARA